MSRVPGWGVLSAGLAPVFLIGGFTVAAAVQPPGFSSVRDTISALAGLGAAHRWLMTAAFVGTGDLLRGHRACPAAGGVAGPGAARGRWGRHRRLGRLPPTGGRSVGRASAGR